MSIHVALHHVTQYRYDRAVDLSPHLVRLRPAPHCRTPILSYSQRITPADHFLNWQQDPQSNYVARLAFPKKVNELRVEVDLVAEMAVYNPFDFFLEPSAEHFPFCYEPGQLAELQPFLRANPLTPLFAGYLKALTRERQRTVDFIVDVNRRLQRDIRTSFASTPACRTSSARSSWDPVRAATPRGCWCNFSAISDWPRASCRVI